MKYYLEFINNYQEPVVVNLDLSKPTIERCISWTNIESYGGLCQNQIISSLKEARHIIIYIYHYKLYNACYSNLYKENIKIKPII